MLDMAIVYINEHDDFCSQCYGLGQKKMTLLNRCHDENTDMSFDKYDLPKSSYKERPQPALNHLLHV